MRRLDAHAHLYGNADRLLEGQPGLLLDILLESDAVHQLHDNIVNAVLLAYVIHIHDIGVHQSGGRLGLRPKFRYKIGILAEFLLQDLDGHEAVQLMTFCLIYVRHASRADFLQYLVTVANHHSNLNHTCSPIYLSRGSIKITLILSLPPFSLAASTSAWAFSTISRAPSNIIKISSSSSILVSPSVHIRIVSPS